VAAAPSKWISNRQLNSLTAIAQPIYQHAHGPRTVRYLLRKSQAGTPEDAQRRTVRPQAIVPSRSFDPRPRPVFEYQPFLSRQSCALGRLVIEADSSRNRVAFAQRAEGPMSRQMSTNTLLVMALDATSALDGQVGIDSTGSRWARVATLCA